MNYQQNAQRDAITQALMNVASPPPRPMMPQAQAPAPMTARPPMTAQMTPQQQPLPTPPQSPQMPADDGYGGPMGQMSRTPVTQAPLTPGPPLSLAPPMGTPGQTSQFGPTGQETIGPNGMVSGF